MSDQRLIVKGGSSWSWVLEVGLVVSEDWKDSIPAISVRCVWCGVVWCVG